MSDLFYRAFEERFRGSREEILARLRAYSVFVEPLEKAFPEGVALDLGCGRGEWLQLLKETRFDSSGVDLNEGMIETCRDLGLKVVQADAISLLKDLPSASQTLVTAFQLVEHLPFEQLQQLVAESYRVLRPGGLLILETPNVENILVATRDFYLDPTHQKPIPSGLLTFMCEFAGFERIKIIRLQEDCVLLDKESVSTRDLLYGASPDYSVICQKQAEPSILGQFDVPFEQHFGLSLEQLIDRYESRLNRYENSLVDAAEQTQQVRLEIEKIHAQLVYWHTHAVNLEGKNQSLLSSRSWRVTAPLRWFGNQLARLRQDGIRSRSIAFIKKLIRKIDVTLLSHQTCRQRLIHLIKLLGLYEFLKSIRQRSHYPSDISAKGVSNPSVFMVKSALTPRAEMIYSDLRVGIANRRKGK